MLVLSLKYELGTSQQSRYVMSTHPISFLQMVAQTKDITLNRYNKLTKKKLKTPWPLVCK
jgi:hypothetical protein